MLTSLSIRNFVLIQQLDIAFHPGFSVITGETGAGKSIILGAIGLILGQRADSKLIFAGEKRCIIEAEFDIQEYDFEQLFEEYGLDYDASQCILRRELNDNGKSRAFINDTPVSLPTLRAIGERLIDIHSQHNNQLLSTESFQLEVLDTLSRDKNIRKDYARLFSDFKEADKKLLEAQKLLSESQADEDYMQYQLKQLDELDLKEGKQAEIESEQQKLEHAEEIQSALWNALNLLQGEDNYVSGALQSLKNAEHQLHAIDELSAEASELAERIHSTIIEIQDVASTLDSLADRIEMNPTRLQTINDWLSALYTAMKKHHTERESDLILERDRIREKLNAVNNSEEYINTLTNEREQRYTNLLKIANEQSAARKKAAMTLEQEIQALLVPLGIPNARFKVDITTLKEPSPTGIDHVTFLFSANQQNPLRPISEVASGGEIARVMLSLKSLLCKELTLPTIIFDEIDTGVSGHIAERMSKMMLEMGSGHHQVLAITHLPQIAAAGEHHYRVFKTESSDKSTSNIELLNENARINEIANMLSGAKVTEAAKENAKELLNLRTAKTSR